MPIDRRSDKTAAQVNNALQRNRSGSGSSQQLQNIMGNDSTKKVIEEGLVTTKSDALAQQQATAQDEASLLDQAEEEVEAEKIGPDHPALADLGIDETMLAALEDMAPKSPKDDLETTLALGISVANVMSRVWGSACEDPWVATSLAMVAMSARNQMPMDEALGYLSETFRETGDELLGRIGEQARLPYSHTSREMKEFFYQAGSPVQAKTMQARMMGDDPMDLAMDTASLHAERLTPRLEYAVTMDEAAQAARAGGGDKLQSGSSDEPA